MKSCLPTYCGSRPFSGSWSGTAIEHDSERGAIPVSRARGNPFKYTELEDTVKLVVLTPAGGRLSQTTPVQPGPRPALQGPAGHPRVTLLFQVKHEPVRSTGRRPVPAGASLQAASVAGSGRHTRGLLRIVRVAGQRTSAAAWLIRVLNRDVRVDPWHIRLGFC